MPQYSGMWTLSQVSQAVKNQTWTGLPPSIVEYLVVAGGGAGGAYQGGGGGAGGLLAGHVGITAGTSYFVTVGGGAPQAAYIATRRMAPFWGTPPKLLWACTVNRNHFAREVFRTATCGLG